MVFFFLIAFIVTFLDLFTKNLVRSRLNLGQEISILPFFSLTHVRNTGVAFGLFPNKNILFILIGISMSVLLVWMAFKQHRNDSASFFAFALVLGGAWGNLTDRIFFGYVTDFLDFFWGTHHWPSFNIADSAICVGAGILILKSFWAQKSETR